MESNLEMRSKIFIVMVIINLELREVENLIIEIKIQKNLRKLQA
jgi:hypothetical protein